MILKNQNGITVYSDGDLIEKEMYKIATEYPGELSEEYISNNSCYTLNNTFSAVRQNILNWYPFRENCDILEVGAGMGAITGLLCKKAKSVTAIEMNEIRAEIIRVRYSNEKNLNVISEDINKWEDTYKFDYIIMVGVLEYAGIFTEGRNPFVTFLENVKKHLKNGGILLFAIENRFGLKYWCGASEDHTMQPYVGIEGYKEKNTAVTFSKKQIENILTQVGFTYNSFYYVLPDYKFPTAVYTDEYLPNHSDIQKMAFTYSKNSLLCLNEKDLYKDILENNSFPFFANSFLVEASEDKLSTNKIVFVSSRSECKKEYRVSTIIDNNKNIYKIPMHSAAGNHIKETYLNGQKLRERGVQFVNEKYENNSIKCTYFDGVRADEVFCNFLSDNDINSVYKMIDLLKNNLLMSSKVCESLDNILTQNGIASFDINFGLILEEGFIDMTFYNSFYHKDELVFFDQEWKFPKVPLNFILYYAIKCIFFRNKIDTSITFGCLVSYIGAEKVCDFYDKLEEYIWSTVLYRQGDLYGADGYCNQYSSELTMEHYFNVLKSEINNEKAHIELLLQSERDLANQAENLKTELNNKNRYIELLLQAESKLREELNNKNGHIELLLLAENKLKAELNNKNGYIEQLLQSENNLKAELNNKNGHIELLLGSERELKNQIENLKIELNNKKGHIELLLNSDRELENIKKSKYWHVISFVRKFRDKVFPFNSKRRLFVKIFAKFSKSPTSFINKLSIDRIKKFFYYLKRESASNLFNIINECIPYHGDNKIKLNVSNVNTSESQTHKISDFETLVFPKVKNPVVSIIIPVYNQIDYTYACLKSVLQNSGDVEYEVIIANDCSTDITSEIDKFVKNIKLISTKTNLRFLLNCNNAAKHAKGKYLLFLNNDTQVQNEWLSPLFELIERDASIGMVGSKLVYPDGRLQEAGGIIWRDASGWNYGRFDDPEKPEYNYVKEVDYISGASIMIRANLWNEIGGFDERFAPAYYEDSDLAFEVRKHGYKVMFQPKSVVVHFEGVSNGTDISEGDKSYQAKNRKKFIEKWNEVLLKEHFVNGQEVFLARNRSKNKKTIVVIDHYVPHYDKDAGGRCTYQYINLFNELGLNTIFIGDNFYKHEPYTTQLQQKGTEVLYGNWYYQNIKDWIKMNGRYFNYIYLNRPHISNKYIDILRKWAKSKIIYFGHDLHYLRELRNYEIEKKEDLLESSAKWKSIEFGLFDKSDVVYAVGDFEKSIIQKEFPDKKVRNIPLYIYDHIEQKEYKFTERKDILFVGGFNHKPNNDAVMWFCKEIFPLVISRYPDLKFYIIGSNPTDEVKNLNSQNIIVKGFVTDDELISFYNKCRLVVVPLRYGAGVKGKIVEALYNQIPIITTSIGAEGLAGSEEALTIADTAIEFSEKLIEMYNNSDRLKIICQKSYEYISCNFMRKNALEIVLQDIEP